MLDPERLTVIPNGIDRGHLMPRSPSHDEAIGIPDDAHLALYVGRLDPQKGLPDLLKAAEQVISQRLKLASRYWLETVRADPGC